jgi:pyruvate/2-oxoglutarate dehydrogenase complex dihydrolipoamide dehydrogenase (E3) component
MRHDVIVIGGGPAGFSAALRAAELGARTALVTSAGVGGMAAHDGPVPVRTLAYAARLAREAEQFDAYGLRAPAPTIDYPKLLARVGTVIDQLHASLRIRERLARLEVELLEDQAARFVDPHVIETETGRRLEADKLVICTGGVSRRCRSRMVEGIAAATNAVRGPTVEVRHDLMPIGSFSDPEYATVGLTEAAARDTRAVVVARTPFAELPRAVIDGRANGFCKLVVDRDSHEVIGAQCVGERAVEIVQVVAAGMQHAVRVEELAAIPFSFPTYIGIVGMCARNAMRAMGSAGLLGAPW